MTLDRLNWDSLEGSGIYKITIDSHIYIGSTKREIKIRIKEHLRALRNNAHYNSLMQYCYNTTNNMIQIDVLEWCNSTDIWKREQYWIDRIKPDLNIIKHVARY